MARCFENSLTAEMGKSIMIRYVPDGYRPIWNVGFTGKAILAKDTPASMTSGKRVKGPRKWRKYSGGLMAAVGRASVYSGDAS